MLYSVQSPTKRRGKEEEIIALMASPLVRIQIINEIRITTVNLLIYHVTAIFRLRQSKPFSNVNEIQKDAINSIIQQHLVFHFCLKMALTNQVEILQSYMIDQYVNRPNFIYIRRDCVSPGILYSSESCEFPQNCINAKKDFQFFLKTNSVTIDRASYR